MLGRVQDNTYTKLNKFFTKQISSASSKNNSQSADVDLDKKFFSISNENLRNMILPSAAEAFVSVAYASAVIPFMEANTKWWANPFTTAAIVVFLNTFSRLKKYDDKDKNARIMARHIRGFFFGILDTFTRKVICHENGHVLFAVSLFKNQRPSFIVQQFGSGRMYWNGDFELTDAGAMLGFEKSYALVSAGGFVVDMLCNYIALIAAQLIADDDSEIKSHLRLMVIISLVHELYYAILGAINCTPDNDFCALESANLIPAAALVSLMMTSSMLLQLFLSFSAKCRASNHADDEYDVEHREQELDEVLDMHVSSEPEPEPEPTETTRLIRKY